MEKKTPTIVRIARARKSEDGVLCLGPDGKPSKKAARLLTYEVLALCLAHSNNVTYTGK
jgi:hypothetical protein